MSDTDLSKITGLLLDWQGGNRDALEELWPLVTVPLARISRNLLRQFVQGESRGGTMCTTDLVHQAFPKLVNYASGLERPWENRVEFYALAKKVMLCVLLDYQRYAVRHGNRSGEELGDDVSLEPQISELSIDDLLDLDRSMELLHEIDPIGHKVITLRFFQDYTMVEIIEEMGYTEYKLYNHLKASLGFLYSKMKSQTNAAG